MTASRLHARRRRQAGFNLLEVMIALAVLTLAAMGVASLQTATTRANLSSRHRATAMDFLQTWVERVKVDGLAWQAGEATPSLFTGAVDNAWFTPTDEQLGDLGETAATFWGIDTDDANQVRYCVNLRGQMLDPGRSLRADVRVWWYREAGDSAATVNLAVPDGQGGTVNVAGPVGAKQDLVAGCGDAATAPLADPRVYSAQVSTVLVAR